MSIRNNGPIIHNIDCISYALRKGVHHAGLLRADPSLLGPWRICEANLPQYLGPNPLAGPDEVCACRHHLQKIKCGNPGSPASSGKDALRLAASACISWQKVMPCLYVVFWAPILGATWKLMGLLVIWLVDMVYGICCKFVIWYLVYYDMAILYLEAHGTL